MGLVLFRQMDLASICAYCHSFPHAEETVPFGPDVLVYKVAGKMFALTVPDDFPAKINLKCDPERALELRDEHPGITAGYHMNKRHWNTLLLDGSVPLKLVHELIEHSYRLVVGALPAKTRKALGLEKQP